MSWITDTWITNSDFNNFNFPASEIDNFVYITEKSVEKYLKKLLGCELFKLFFDDFENETGTQKYIDLRDGKDIVLENGTTFCYQGLKEMCQLLAMYEALVKPYVSSPIGFVSEASNNEDRINVLQNKDACNAMYNDAVKLYNDAVFFINENIDDYQEALISVLKQKHSINY